MLKRRKYFIEKKFQLNFILKFCLIVVIATLLIGALLFLATGGTTTVAIENTKVVVKKTSDFLLPIILTSLIFGIVFSAVSVSILCLFISHKIAGPLYRINKEVSKMGEGDFNVNFSIRQGDQFKELAGSLTNMSFLLKTRIKELKALFNELASRGYSEVSKDILASLKKILESFKT